MRAGDLVEVRSAEEIGQTLDADGTLDGLPFMPEMMAFCGRPFRVLRTVEKTCVEVGVGRYDFHEFPQNDVVLLEGLRCSGNDHGRCQRMCVLFWKAAWLRRPEELLSVSSHPEKREGLRPTLKTELAPGRYFCQSTELAKATRAIPRGKRVLKCFYDVRDGNVGLLRMLEFVIVPLWRKATFRFRKPLAGNLRSTPAGTLGLQPGETVQIRPIAEIAQTLDAKGRNRGLQYDRLLGRYSGGTYQVRGRLDRMISEVNGEMRTVQGTVILDGLHCMCHMFALGGCPRQDVIYWREVWLERTGNGKADSAQELSPGCSTEDGLGEEDIPSGARKPWN